MDDELHFYHEEKPPASRDGEIAAFLAERWGVKEVVSRGKVHDASTLPRIIARDSGGVIMGLATYAVDSEAGSCELVTIDATTPSKGIGSRLIREVETAAAVAGCDRVWLITTNDNIDALRFYINNGYRLTAVHLDALDRSRELKPEIPKIGKQGIPLQDEWELMKLL